MISDLSSNKDKNMVDSIFSSFGMGLTKQLVLQELNVVCLLKILKEYLGHFDSPLFTFPISTKYTSKVPKNLNKICKKKFFKKT